MRFDASEIGHHDVLAFSCDVTSGSVESVWMRPGDGRPNLGLEKSMAYHRDQVGKNHAQVYSQDDG